jgi:hypothetical protein
VEKGTKLGGRVREGRWLGMDEESKGAWVYWPDTKAVLVEQNIYFKNQSASRIEEEEVGENGRKRVLRLWKTLYGLKQAGRRWYHKLVDIMSKLAFSRCGGDQAVFVRRCERMNVLIVVLVHVDRR